MFAAMTGGRWIPVTTILATGRAAPSTWPMMEAAKANMRHQDIERRLLIELNNNSIQCFIFIVTVIDVEEEQY